MQNRVCRTLVIFSYLVFFTMFLLFTNQYNLLLRFIGNNLVTHTVVPLITLTSPLGIKCSKSNSIIQTIEASAFVSRTILAEHRVTFVNFNKTLIILR